MPEFRHTWLFEPGLWEARGTYYDAAGRRFPHEGHALITHQPDVWINEGSMKIQAEPPMEFQNRYEIQPFFPGRDHTTWRSFNPDLETLVGRFIVVEDSITSPWRSESGLYWGTEFLIQVSAVEYRGRGHAFKGDEKLSSWSVRMVRKG